MNIKPLIYTISLFFFLMFYIKVKAQSIEESDKAAILKAVKKSFSLNYHFKDKIDTAIRHIDKQSRFKKYAKMDKLSEFLPALAADLQFTNQDKHLNFIYTPAAYLLPDTNSTRSITYGNFNEGLKAIKILPGNIGYLETTFFGDHAANKALIAAVFTFLKNSEALIIDLRKNGGGQLSNLMSSYLLPADSIHLNTIFWSNNIDSVYTYKKLDAPRYLNKPVYLLTSQKTFSSAEEFAYDLQNLKRASIVGEVTGGGANPGQTFEIYHFRDGSLLELFIPTGHVENPITKTNWEAKGITPDYFCKAADALRESQILALKELQKQTKSTMAKKQYALLIEKLMSAPDLDN